MASTFSFSFSLADVGLRSQEKQRQSGAPAENIKQCLYKPSNGFPWRKFIASPPKSSEFEPASSESEPSSSSSGLTSVGMDSYLAPAPRENSRLASERNHTFRLERQRLELELELTPTAAAV